MSKEAMKLALEALFTYEDDWVDDGLGGVHHNVLYEKNKVFKAITALREAMAEQQALDKMAENARELGIQMQPAQETDQSVMYTYPSKQEPIPCGKPIGILMKQKGDEHMKLYPLAEQAAQQEPVAWRWQMSDVHPHLWQVSEKPHKMALRAEPLYTSPPAQRTWVGLTDEDFQAICKNFRISHGGWIDMLALEIEAKLKEKNT